MEKNNPAFVAPAHVERVLTSVSEELNRPDSKYVMNVTNPVAGAPQRVTVDFALKDAATDTEGHQEAIQLASRSVHVSCIEYPANPAVSANKITAIVFEQRRFGSFPATKTRHYVEPSFEGHEITAITHCSLAGVGVDIVTFFSTGKTPA